MESEARVTSGYDPLSRCARALTEKMSLLIHWLQSICDPVNHQLRHTTPPHVLTQLKLTRDSLRPLICNFLLSAGHLAVVHRSKRSCFQEHQDHRWVFGWWADQRSQGDSKLEIRPYSAWIVSFCLRCSELFFLVTFPGFF